MIGEIAERFLRQVCIDYNRGGMVDKIHALLHALRCEVPIDVHICDGKLHLTMLIHDKEVRRRGLAGNGHRRINVNMNSTAAVFEFLSVCVLSECGKKTYLTAEKGKVMGNISTNATGGHSYRAGV